jgi:hypothetical protein
MWVAIAVVVLVVAAFALVYFNQEKIKSILVGEINRCLTTEVKVKQIDVTLISTFPDVALTFNDVLACDAYEGEASSDTLFFFHRLYLSFDVLDILKSNYNIKKIKAEDGQFNMKIRKDGKTNYVFWKRNDTASNTNFRLQLNAIKLNDVTYSFRNDCTHQYYKIFISKGYANGNFYASQQTIKLNAETVLQNLQADNLVLATNLPLTLKLHCENDTEQGKLQLNKSHIQAGKMKFDINGYLNYGKENFIDVSLAGNQISIKQLIALLPANVSKIFKDYQSKGNLVFKSTIKGRVDKRNVPALDADFKINNGSLFNKASGITLNQINLVGKYSNGKQHNSATSVIDVSHFSTQFCEGLVKGSLRLSDFAELNVEANLNTDLDLQKLQAFLQIKQVASINGNLKCDIKANGSLKQIKNVAKDVTMSGKADVANLNLKIKDLDYSLSKTDVSFEFDNRSIKVLNLKGLLNNQPLAFTGTITNPLDFAFKNTNLLSLDGNLQLAAFEYKTDKTKSSDSSTFSLPKNLNLDLNLQVASFKYANLHLQNIKSNFKLSNSGFTLTNLSCNAFNGQISGTTGLVEAAKEGYNLFGSLNIVAVDISAAFKGLNNFGQKALTDANIKGKLSATATYNIAFDKQFNALQDKISASVAYKVENGGLHNVALLQKLSHFVEESALQDMTFATIESALQIKDGCINFEPLKVQSNVLSFEFLGKHYLKSNNIDYHFAIRLTELASKKKKAKMAKQQQDFGTLEQDADSRLTLFVKIGGSIDKPVFSYDMKRNLEQAKQTLKEDKQKISLQIQNDLKINSEQVKKDRSQWSKQSKGQWVIEWEDSPPDTAVSKPQKDESPDLIIEW